MLEVKRPTTYEEQLSILKSRGCLLIDENFCLEKLSLINYYRISAYFLPFKQNDGFYSPGTSFEKIYRIYEFDRKLRNILYSAIEVIEISLRTRMSYLHATKYGALGYLNADNFNTRHNATKFEEKIHAEIERNSKVLFVKHHIENYDTKFPIWVVSELFTFGMLSYFYTDLKTCDQKEIAKLYHANYKDTKSWLRCLTDLRNICAHYGRLYYRIFSASPSGFNIDESKKRRLWGVVLVLKSLYPSTTKWNSEFIARMEQLFQEYREDINLYHLAFPKNWNELLRH